MFKEKKRAKNILALVSYVCKVNACSAYINYYIIIILILLIFYEYYCYYFMIFLSIFRVHIQKPDITGCPIILYFLKRVYLA